MANEVLDKALEGFALGEIDWDLHKIRAYLVDINAVVPPGGAVGGYVVTGVTADGSFLATVTTSAAHGLAVGNRVAIWGVGGATGVNGNRPVNTVPTTTTFTVQLTAAPGAYASGGFIANLSKTFLSEYAPSASRSAVSAVLTTKTAPLGVLKSATISWTGLTAGPFEVIVVVKTADADATADSADTAQRLIAHLDSLTGLPIQQNPGNVNYTPDATNGIGRL